MSSRTDVCEHGRVLFFSLFCVRSKFGFKLLLLEKENVCGDIGHYTAWKTLYFRIIYVFNFLHDHHDHSVRAVQTAMDKVLNLTKTHFNVIYNLYLFG